MILTLSHSIFSAFQRRFVGVLFVVFEVRPFRPQVNSVNPEKQSRASSLRTMDMGRVVRLEKTRNSNAGAQQELPPPAAASTSGDRT